MTPGSYEAWLADFHARRAADTRPLDMAGHPAPAALPASHCDHVALYWRWRQLQTPAGHWNSGVFSRRAYRYEEASHRGYLVDQIPARWPAPIEQRHVEAAARAA